MATETRQPQTGRLSPSYWVENLSESAFAYLMLLPAFGLVGAFAIWPLVSTFEMSLHADSLVGTGFVGEFVGFDRYAKLLGGELDAVLGAAFVNFDQPLRSALLVTLVFTAVSVTLELLLGFGQALVLDQEFTGRRWVRVAVLIPWAVPIAIQGMIFYLMFQGDSGFAKQILSAVGLVSETPFIYSADLLLIVVVADVWKTSAFIALIALAGLQSINRDLYRVARVAGASTLQRFRMVTFPLIVPALLVALLFRTIQAMRVFGVIETVGGPGGCDTLPSLSCMVVDAFQGGRYATAAAVAFVTAIIVALVASVYIYGYADVEGGGA